MKSLTPRPILALLVGIALHAALAGCSMNTAIGILTHEPAGKAIHVNAAPVAPPSRSGVFRAGVARVDITPPPGFPTGGHGPAGNLARGHWGRLWARAFFFEDTNGRIVVFVSCDVFAVPGGLRDMVAERLAHRRVPGKDDAVPPGIPADALVIAATHTHQGSGNYLTSKLYNKFGSAFPGFNDKLLEFLVSRVTDAVRRAERDARKNGPASLTLHTGVVGDIVLNRSPDVFLLNRTAQPFMNELESGNGGTFPCARKPGEPTTGWELQGCPRLRAVNRRMSVLEVDRGGEKVGLMVFFAVHPTVLEHNAPIYSPDFTGLASSLLERADTERGRPSIVGFFNGAEGDVTARRTERDIRDVAELARGFAGSINAIVKLPGIALGPSPEIQVRSERVPVEAVSGTKDDAGATCSVGTDTYRLAGKPNGGVAAFGGAEADRTILYDLGWREAVRDRPQHGQGPKLPALDSAYLRDLKPTSTIVKLPDFPPSLPLSILSIGPLSIATIPVEASTFVGAQIRAALRTSPKPSDGPVTQDFVQIVGLANEYASYVASRDEYMRQDYMGASTLWGPDEGAFLACRLAALSVRDAPYPKETSRDFPTYHPGPTERQVGEKEPFGPSFCGDLRAAPDEELEDVLAEHSPKQSPARNLPWFSWNEAARNNGGGAGHGTVEDDFSATSCRVVAIDQLKSGTWTPWVGAATPDDGAGSGFVTTLLYGADKPVALPADHSGGDAVSEERDILWRRYAALWLGPLFEPASLTGSYRFRVRLPDGTMRCSDAFPDRTAPTRGSAVPAPKESKNPPPCPALPPPETCHFEGGKS
jgi:neutral ceramidase